MPGWSAFPPRRLSGHAERGLVEVEDRFLFLPLGLVLLAQAHDGANGLGVEAFSPPHESVV